MMEEDKVANPCECVDIDVLLYEELQADRDEEVGVAANEVFNESIDSVDDNEPPVMSDRQATQFLFELETFFL